MLTSRATPQASLWHFRDVTHIFEHKLYEFINNHLKLMDMELQVNEREALLIVTALGTYQNRVGQHTSWDQRKRQPTLRARLADCVTIGDDEEAKAVRKALAKTKRRIERGMNLGLEISALRERVKAETGINDEKVNPKDDEEERISEAQG
jgi:hypothetical protein